jgi:predicted O-methyltransferase YrrM
MVNYDLSHLTQRDDQAVVGPIQDDEALFLYSIIRGMRIKRILEIGGLDGYSATNFLKATRDLDGAMMYTVDINPVSSRAPNHKCIIKDARLLTPEDLDNVPLDMVFFDCHEYNVQMDLFNKLVENNIITDDTVIALHDTNLHYSRDIGWAYPCDDGFVHQAVERKMVNTFKEMGYDVFSIRTTADTHRDRRLPYRHGVSICQKFKFMKT